MKAIKAIVGKIRAKRESQGLSKSEAARKFSLGRNFLHDVEQGKETSQFGKVIHYAKEVGIEIIGFDKQNPLEPLEIAIAAAIKTDKNLANRLIASLTEDEKQLIHLPEVQNRRKSSIKKISLSL